MGSFECRISDKEDYTGLEMRAGKKCLSSPNGRTERTHRDVKLNIPKSASNEMCIVVGGPKSEHNEFKNLAALLLL